MQEYCGCVYSLRDTNKWRVANGRPKITLGEKHYET
jgi:epoxyqueuosine reductase